MARRNGIPVILLAVLTALTAVFALIGVLSAPDSATLTVQNGTAETFGSPLGANSFSMNLTSQISAGPGTGTLSQTRLIKYVPPSHLAVYRTGPPVSFLGTVSRTAIEPALASYAAIVAGSTLWIHQGSRFVRTESLKAFVNRVRPPSNVPVTTAKGKVFETAIVRRGYLVYLKTSLRVQNQTLAGGTPAVSGVEGTVIQLLQINGRTAPGIN